MRQISLQSCLTSSLVVHKGFQGGTRPGSSGGKPTLFLSPLGFQKTNAGTQVHWNTPGIRVKSERWGNFKTL